MVAKLSPQDRQRRLNEASEQYLAGKLGPEEFERVERSYGTDYRAAAHALAQKRVRPVRGWKRFVQRAVSA